ncbi:hypothetical protein [Candidatus Enterovibrio escicola]|uniref:hypothetical protein n=1 Tax=Candidatus Enterovibrio escicola TaxID=1927127 RepID=UPI001237E98F|nr:hypothetical protein [Candidatus Enterovibrio escacola]
MVWTVNNDPDQIVLFAGGQPSLSRYVTDLKVAGGMYYTIPSITLTSGEYVEIEAFAGDTAWHTVISDESRNGEIRKNGDGTVELVGTASAFSVTLDGTPVVSLVTLYPNDGKIHTWRITTITTLTYSTIGVRGNLSGTMSGGFFGCKFFSSSGEVLRDYRFDDNDGVLVDYIKPIGSEIYDFTKFAKAHVNSTLVELPNNGFAFDGTLAPDGESAERCFINITTQAGVQYLLKYNQLSNTTGTIFPRDGLNGSGTVLVSAPFNSKYLLFTATSSTTTILFDGNTAQEVYSFDGISIKQADGYGQSVNVTAADRELMTFDVSRDAWLGQELVTQQVWENPASVGSVWSFANNEWTMTGDGSFSSLTLLPSSSTPSTGIIQGEVLAMDGSNNLVATQDNGIPITNVGAYERDFNIATHIQYQYKRGSGVLNVTISKPSFKKIIEVAQ